MASVVNLNDVMDWVLKHSNEAYDRHVAAAEKKEHENSARELDKHRTLLHAAGLIRSAMRR